VKLLTMIFLALTLAACARAPYASNQLAMSGPQPPVGAPKCFDCIGYRQDANPN
jgi:hypothetical protein